MYQAFAPTLMVARLQWAKDDQTEKFSTNMTSDLRDVEHNVFELNPYRHSGAENSEAAQDDIVERMQTTGHLCVDDSL